MKVVNVEAGAHATSARAVILTADKFEDLELLVPYFRLREGGVHVDVAAPTLEDIGCEHGYSLSPDVRIDEVDPDTYDLLIVPGGFPDGAPATVRDSSEARSVVQAFFETDKPVASICHGPWLLAAADVARGRRMTSYWHDGVPEDIKEAGGLWEDAPVVVDGNLVTSRWPPDLPAFTDEMMALLARRVAP